MPRALELVIKAKDQASAAFKGVQQSARGLKSSLAELGKFAGIATASIAGAVKIVDSAITPFVNYARQVKELSLAIGTNAEETSRLIQLSDDYKIEVGELRAALQIATKNGFAPSIDSLAQLADRMKGISDPTKRAAELSKIFGRNWTALAPLLEQGGDAIRAQAAGIKDSLIMTDEAIKRAREWELAQDEFNDTIEAGKLSVGRFLVEGLLPYVRILKDLPAIMEGVNRHGSTMERMWFNAATGGLFLRDAAREATPAVAELGSATETAGTQAEIAGQKMETLVVSTGKLTAASLGAAAMRDLDAALQAGTITQSDYDVAARRVMSFLLELPPAQIDANFALRELSDQMADGELTAKGYSDRIFDLNRGIQGLQSKTIKVTTIFEERRTGGRAARVGHQFGGRFEVEGEPGTDRVPVGFMATPGELVEITPRNEAASRRAQLAERANGRPTGLGQFNLTVQSLQIVLQGAQPTAEIGRQAAQAIMDEIGRRVRQATASGAGFVGS